MRLVDSLKHYVEKTSIGLSENAAGLLNTGGGGGWLLTWRKKSFMFDNR